jgi:hypothetical protein
MRIASVTPRNFLGLVGGLAVIGITGWLTSDGGSHIAWVALITSAVVIVLIWLVVTFGIRANRSSR